MALKLRSRRTRAFLESVELLRRTVAVLLVLVGTLGFRIIEQSSGFIGNGVEVILCTARPGGGAGVVFSIMTSSKLTIG